MIPVLFLAHVFEQRAFDTRSAQRPGIGLDAATNIITLVLVVVGEWRALTVVYATGTSGRGTQRWS